MGTRSSRTIGGLEEKGKHSLLDAGNVSAMTDALTHSLHSSRLLYGCMGLGGTRDDPAYGSTQIDRAWDALHAAVEIGITVLDTADIYRAGSSEQIVGEILSRDPELRAAVHIQTKCGVILSREGGTGMPSEVGRYDSSAAHITESLEKSLERLRVDRIDTLLLHRPDPLMDSDEVAEALGDALTHGLIGRWGVSNMGPWQMELLKAEPGVPDVDQVELSLSARGFVETAINAEDGGQPGSRYPAGTVEYCASRGIEVQAWSPLARGRFTGAPESALGRARTPEEVATSELVSELAEAHSTTPETIVLWWLTRHPGRIHPVIGTTDPERIRACADANTRDSELTRVEWYRLLTAARGHAVP